MTVKAQKVAELLGKVELGWPVPAPLGDATLLEEGLNAVLLRHVDAKKAATAVQRLRARYDDWNELRIAQAQEISQCMRIGAKGLAAARDVRTYLQEVFQQTHGIELEFLRDDAQASARFVNQLPFMGLGTAHYLLWIAGGEELPITAGLVRVLDRLGVISRTTSTKKARAAIEPLIADSKGGVLDFIVRAGEVASRWCDARKPLCHLCALVDDCKHGKKVFRDWKVQQERLEAQRKREAARMEAQRKKDDERRRREQERALKKARAEEEKRKRAAEREAKALAKKREAEAKKAAREKARLDAQKKREQERARKKAAAERKKKAAAKKAAAAKKKAAAAKKKAAAAKKKAAKKKATKKKVTKKKAAKKKTKSRSRTTARKKPAARPKAKKKATKKKTSSRKTSSSRKTARKTARKK